MKNFNKFMGTTNLPESMDIMQDPSDFFSFLFPDDLLPLKLTKLELQQFIGITMFMSPV